VAWLQRQEMLKQINTKAVQVAMDIKKHWKGLVLASPLLLAPIFIAIVETLPAPPVQPPGITVTLPPVRPYDATREVFVRSGPEVRTERTVVYVEVPTKPSEVPHNQTPAIQTPTAPIQFPQRPSIPGSPSELDRAFIDPVPAPAQLHQSLITPVQFDKSHRHRFQPDYPQDLRANGVEGVVKVHVVVGSNGRPRSIIPIGSPNRQLFEITRRYGMNNWRFRPATVAGAPSTGEIDVSLAFRLSDM
jgi:protein TonB